MPGRDLYNDGYKSEEKKITFDHYFANDLNSFYARLDTNDYTDKCDKLCQSQDYFPLTLVESEAVKYLSRVNPFKAPGPDGCWGRILKVYADQLGPLFIRFFSSGF